MLQCGRKTWWLHVQTNMRQCKIPFIFTGRNEVVAKVMFLLVSVILFTGGCLPQYMLGYHPPPPGGSSPPREADTPREVDSPRKQTPQGSRLRHTVNERPVRMLLECILVPILFISLNHFHVPCLAINFLSFFSVCHKNNKIRLNLNCFRKLSVCIFYVSTMLMASY